MTEQHIIEIAVAIQSSPARYAEYLTAIAKYRKEHGERALATALEKADRITGRENIGDDYDETTGRAG